MSNPRYCSYGSKHSPAVAQGRLLEAECPMVAGPRAGKSEVAARVDRRASSETALSSSRDEQSAHSTPRGLTAGAILLCLLACEHKVVTVRYTYVVGGSGT